MTIKELIQKLQKYDENIEILIDDGYYGFGRSIVKIGWSFNKRYLMLILKKVKKGII